MRIDPDTCRDPVLLSAEVRRLQAVITAGEPALTDAEREALERICEAADDIIDEDKRANGVYWQDDAAAVAVVRGLLERLGGGR